ncbi:hypothetical protein [Micromonospora phytophila]|uniref:hypothetical protein n=1 Tax=Micromonospora phytophila TaxID=709888 RepID=UPI0035581887
MRARRGRSRAASSCRRRYAGHRKRARPGGNAPLCAAAAWGYTDVVQELLAHDADLDKRRTSSKAGQASGAVAGEGGGPWLVVEAQTIGQIADGSIPAGQHEELEQL